MNDEKIPEKFFIIPKKGLIKFKSEKDIKLLEYDENKWNRLFPKEINGKKIDIDMKKLKLTNIAEYSIAKPFISNELKQLIEGLIKTHFKRKKPVITETNGGVGGFSLQLIDIVDKVNIVEIIPIHANIIKNNLEVYKMDSKKKDINIYNKDYLDILYDLKQDIIICDPPWGGIENYKKFRYMKLGLNNINITYIINRLYEENKFKIFILLAMKNFDIQNFINLSIAKKITIHNMGKHYFIVVYHNSMLS